MDEGLFIILGNVILWKSTSWRNLVLLRAVRFCSEIFCRCWFSFMCSGSSFRFLGVLSPWWPALWELEPHLAIDDLLRAGVQLKAKVDNVTSSLLLSASISSRNGYGGDARPQHWIVIIISLMVLHHKGKAVRIARYSWYRTEKWLQIIVYTKEQGKTPNQIVLLYSNIAP